MPFHALGKIDRISWLEAMLKYKLSSETKNPCRLSKSMTLLRE